MRGGQDIEQTEGSAYRDSEEQGYRNLIATILSMANEDCATGPAAEALDAYRWVEGDDPQMRLYCELLGIDPDLFRDAFVTQHRARCERLIVRQIDREEQLRDEEDARAHKAGMRAVGAAERYIATMYNKLHANKKPANRPPRPVLSDEERARLYRAAASKELKRLWDKKA